MKDFLSAILVSAVFAQAHYFLTQLIGYGKWILYNPNDKLESSLWVTKTVILLLILFSVKVLRERFGFYKASSVVGATIGGVVAFSLVVSLVQAIMLDQRYVSVVDDITMTRSAIVVHTLIAAIVAGIGVLFSSHSSNIPILRAAVEKSREEKKREEKKETNNKKTIDSEEENPLEI